MISIKSICKKKFHMYIDFTSNNFLQSDYVGYKDDSDNYIIFHIYEQYINRPSDDSENYEFCYKAEYLGWSRYIKTIYNPSIFSKTFIELSEDEYEEIIEQVEQADKESGYT